MFVFSLDYAQLRNEQFGLLLALARLATYEFIVAA